MSVSALDLLDLDCLGDRGLLGMNLSGYGYAGASVVAYGLALFISWCWVRS